MKNFSKKQKDIKKKKVRGIDDFNDLKFPNNPEKDVVTVLFSVKEKKICIKRFQHLNQLDRKSFNSLIHFFS